MEQLLCQLQQVLETHEVNWKHVLGFLSTLLVYNPLAQPALKGKRTTSTLYRHVFTGPVCHFTLPVVLYWTELLSRLLTSAFDGYDLENMITAFLLARQGALEGPSVFPSYTDWFKVGHQFVHTSTKHVFHVKLQLSPLAC